MKLLHHDTIIPPEREVITVYKDDDEYCYAGQFGRIYDWQLKQHVQHHPSAHSRLCMHRLTPPQRTLLLATDWATQLHWQMRQSDFVLASRVGDIVTVAFDVIGPVTGCHHKPNHHKPENRWHYQLYHVRWWDQDDFANNVLLGVWP